MKDNRSIGDSNTYKFLDADSLEDLADKTLDQIKEMRYDTELKENGVRNVLKFGIAYSGKRSASN